MLYRIHTLSYRIDETWFVSCREVFNNAIHVKFQCQPSMPGTRGHPLFLHWKGVRKVRCRAFWWCVCTTGQIFTFFKFNLNFFNFNLIWICFNSIPFTLVHLIEFYLKSVPKYHLHNDTFSRDRYIKLLILVELRSGSNIICLKVRCGGCACIQPTCSIFKMSPWSNPKSACCVISIAAPVIPIYWNTCCVHERQHDVFNDFGLSLHYDQTPSALQISRKNAKAESKWVLSPEKNTDVESYIINAAHVFNFPVCAITFTIAEGIHVLQNDNPVHKS